MSSTTKKLKNPNFSEDDFYDIFTEGTFGMSILDLTGKFIRVNKAATKIWGYSEKELQKMKFADITHPEEIERDVKAVKMLAEGQLTKYRVEKRYIKKDGSIIWALINVFLLKDENKKPLYFVTIIEDVTESHKIREILEISEKRYQNLLENSIVGIIIAQGDPIKIVFANEPLSRMLGYSPEEFKKMQSQIIKKMVYKDDRKKFFQRYIARLKGEKLDSGYEFRGVCKDGSIKWFDYYATKMIYNNKPAIQAAFIDITDKKEVQLALEKSEFKFKAIFQETFQFTGLMQPNGILIEANNAALDFAKVKREDVVEKFFWNCPWWSYSRKIQKTLKGVIKKASQGHFIRFETKVSSSDGRLIDIDFSIKPIKDKNGKVVLLIPEGRDISQSKKIEETLKSNQHQLESIIDFFPDATLVIDKDKKIVGWNQAIEKMTGIPREKMLGKEHSFASVPFYGKRREYIIDLLYKKDKEIKKKYTYVKKEGKNYYAEAFAPKINHGKGAFLWVAATKIHDSSGKIIGAIESIRDITERKKTEEVIKKNEEKLESLLNSMEEIVIDLDTNGKIIFCHTPEENNLQIDTQKIINQKYTKIFSKDISKSISKGIQLNKKHKKTHNFEFSLMFNKRNLWFSVKITPIFYDKIYGGSVLVIRDTTREKEIDAMKTEFVSLASHQLRTPLTSINWNCELLLNDKENNLSDEQKETLQEISSSNKRMIILVNSLLNVARLEMGTVMISPQNVDPKTICEPVIKDLMSAIKKHNLVIKEICDPELKSINVDPKLLEIIFQNLLSNAVKYSFDNTEIKIRSEIDKINKTFTISVSNYGIGIPVEKKARIFEKLFRTDNARLKDPDGTGLGLYIIKLILEQSGGSIWFESAENGLTTFFVKLPLAGMHEKHGTKELV